MNEGSLRCDERYVPSCTSPTEDYYQVQADHVVRVATRTLSMGVEAFIWYTLYGPGWDSSGLLDATHASLPAYIAYQNLITQVHGFRTRPTEVTYARGVEAYRFTNPGSTIVDVLWSVHGLPVTVSLPQSTFVRAVDQSGESLTPTSVGGDVQFTTGWGAIYIHRQP